MPQMDTLSYLYQLNEKYEKIDTLNIFQHAVQALLLLNEQVGTGGYIQLVQNGFGEYIFENPWQEVFQKMNAEKLAKNMQSAKVFYQKNKTELSKETTLEEFTKMYEKYPELNALQDDYLNMINAELENIHQYIVAHPDIFETQ